VLQASPTFSARAGFQTWQSEPALRRGNRLWVFDFSYLEPVFGILNDVVVNAPEGGSIQIADALTNPGPYIAGDTAFALPEAGTTLDYQTSFYVGLTIVISEMTNGSVTISFG